MQRFASRIAFAVLASCCVATPVCAHGAGTNLATTGIPRGFEELVEPRELWVDVFFGGQKVGETTIVASPGFVRFKEAAKVASLIPNLIDGGEVTSALAGNLAANAALSCSRSPADGCGKLSPSVVAVIFDEGQFRVELFVHRKLLGEIKLQTDTYLSVPKTPLSLASSFGLAVSGTAETTPTYNFQARALVALRNGRVRANGSIASNTGLVVDDLVGELDWNGFRSSAGLFWAPGLDLTGRRRILGVGLGTQFDTRADRQVLLGSPLIVFLAQPARVEIFVDGRLSASQAYDAGNNVLDTAGLPDGSYPLVLRIRERSGAVREERRFFVKNANMPPVGQPIYHAYVGVLADTRLDQPVSLTNKLFYQVGTARRLNHSFAVDLSAIGTQSKSMAEAGIWLVTRRATIRAAGLISTSGDKGVIVQLGSAADRKLNFHFDLRRIWSRDGQPLIPLPRYTNNFESGPPVGAQIGSDSYTQASGSLALSLGPADLSLIGSLRRDKGLRPDYTIGPHINWPIVNRGTFQLTLQGDVQRTRDTTVSFLGFRMMYTSRGFSTLATNGYSSVRRRGHTESNEQGLVSSFTGQYSHESRGRTQIYAGGGIDRSPEATTMHANAAAYSSLGSVRGDYVLNLDGPHSSQYGLTVQSGALVTTSSVGVGGRDLAESGIIASVSGKAGKAQFQVLIDEQPRGVVRSGSSLPIFLQPYRAYSVRLQAMDSAPVNYDLAIQKVTLFPGNVQHLSWAAQSLFTVFGQAVRPDGTPVAKAMIRSGRETGQSDDDGYFQVDVSENETLEFDEHMAIACQVRLSGVKRQDNFASVGKVTCQ